MLSKLIMGHHTFEGSEWKKLCNTQNSTMDKKRRTIQEDMKKIEIKKERVRADNAILQCKRDIQMRVSAKAQRKEQLAEILKTNDAAYQERRKERRERSRNQAGMNPFDVPGSPCTGIRPSSRPTPYTPPRPATTLPGFLPPGVNGFNDLPSDTLERI